MSWGQSRRPIVSSTLSYPNQREGSDGDIQIRQTNLGAKLFGKVGGSWYGAPLTGTAGDPVMRIGTKLENHLAISGDKLEFMKGSKSMLSITSTGDINMTGKIILTSVETENVCIGTGNVDIGTNNVCIGVDAGTSLNNADAIKNALIGSEAGKDVTEGAYNVCIGFNAGDDLTAGDSNIHIGSNSTSSGGTVTGEAVIVAGAGRTGLGTKTMLLGSWVVNAGNIYNVKDATAWDQVYDVRLKINIVDVQENVLILINQVKIRNFNWKEEEDLPKVNGKPYFPQDPDELRVGIIAQELENVLPQCIGEDGNGYKSFNANDMNFLIIKAVQELSAKVDTMQEEINTLKAE